MCRYEQWNRLEKRNTTLRKVLYREMRQNRDTGGTEGKARYTMYPLSFSYSKLGKWKRNNQTNDSKDSKTSQKVTKRDLK